MFLSILASIGCYWTIFSDIGQCASISEAPEDNHNSLRCPNIEQYLAIFFKILDNVWDNISKYCVKLYNNCIILLTLFPMRGPKRPPPPQYFCDCLGTVIARTLKCFDFSYNQGEQMLKKKTIIEFLFFTPPYGPPKDVPPGEFFENIIF